jgi:hypothetical protein
LRRRYRFPAEVISYAVYLYFRFPLSLRMVEEMLAVSGIEVSHETVRKWGLKFGGIVLLLQSWDQVLSVSFFTPGYGLAATLTRSAFSPGSELAREIWTAG